MPEFDSTLEYRDVVGFSGYKVGSDGSVWSCWKRVGGGCDYGSFHVIGSVWRRMKPERVKSGHLRIHLRPGKRRWQIHRLVLEAFVGPCPPGLEACHDPDHTPSNNTIGNLRWDTKQANYRDRDRQGRTARGERNGWARLTAAIVRLIRSDFETGQFTKRSLGRKYGFNETTIYRVVTRKAWKHVV